MDHEHLPVHVLDLNDVAIQADAHALGNVINDNVHVVPGVEILQHRGDIWKSNLAMIPIFYIVTGLYMKSINVIRI